MNPKTVFEPHIEPKKVKNDPKNKLKSNFTIEENIENKGCSTT